MLLYRIKKIETKLLASFLEGSALSSNLIHCCRHIDCVKVAVQIDVSGTVFKSYSNAGCAVVFMLGQDKLY